MVWELTAMPDYVEEDILNAIQDVTDGLSIRKAASRWGVPRTTLHNRLAGIKPKRIAHRDSQKLLPSQEAYLANWVGVQQALGNPPSHQQLRYFAQRIVAVNGQSSELGKRWVNRFLKRWPSIRPYKARAIENRRVNSATPDVIRKWCYRFQVPAIKAIKPENR